RQRTLANRRRRAQDEVSGLCRGCISCRRRGPLPALDSIRRATRCPPTRERARAHVSASADTAAIGSPSEPDLERDRRRPENVVDLSGVRFSWEGTAPALIDI